MNMELESYHFCSKGLKSDLLFKNVDEFIAGMNRIAVSYLISIESKHPISIIAFCLMNNHFHFILNGAEANCNEFIERYKRLTGIWLGNHRKEKFCENIEIGHWRINSTVSLRNKIIYNLRQALEAGQNVTPQGYPWSSARLMFYDDPLLNLYSKPISEYSMNQIKHIFSKTAHFPDSWLVLPGDLIWPGNYVDYKEAEHLFRSVGDFMYMLNNSSVDKETNLVVMNDLAIIPDSQILEIVKDFITKRYGKNYISKCNTKERLEVAKFLRKEYKCGHGQIARILKMDPDAVAALV